MGAIRLFLALVVVAGHWQALVLRGRGTYVPEEYLLGFNAGYAVMFFYIVSGFLITFTLTKNYDMSPRGYARFYVNRFIRIFSLYWPLAIISFAVTGGLTAWLAGGPVNVLAGTFLIFSDWLVTFGAPGGQYFGSFPPHMKSVLDARGRIDFLPHSPAAAALVEISGGAACCLNCRSSLFRGRSRYGTTCTMDIHVLSIDGRILLSGTFCHESRGTVANACNPLHRSGAYNRLIRRNEIRARGVVR